MAELAPSRRPNGFSLVEMMVVMMFMLILMAGMATVFKTSLANLYTSGEVLSSARRSRMSIDQLTLDLNTAGMYLIDPNDDPAFSTNNPSFYILPNMPCVGAPGTPQTGEPATADQLFFYMDQALPFEGTLTVVPAATAGPLVLSGALPTSANYTYTVDCKNATYAQQVLDTYNTANTNGQPEPWFIFKDAFETGYISQAPVVAGTTVQVVAGASPNVGITGVGTSGLPTKTTHLVGSGVLFVQAAQMVRYSVQYLQLDPTNANGTPCLVRDQGTYSPTGFVSNLPQQIITENIAGFKVYLSVNAGQTWAGTDLGVGVSGFAAGWTNGILTTDALSLANQVAAEVTAGWVTPSGIQAVNLANNPDWFRYLPVLVRVDVTTRTASQRADYSSAGNALAYKTQTQSLVFVPRHSGLTLN